MKKKCENCKKLRKEINMLEDLISLSRPEEWDVDGTYEDIVEGREGEKENGKPDLEFAKWFAKRYHIGEEPFD